MGDEVKEIIVLEVEESDEDDKKSAPAKRAGDVSAATAAKRTRLDDVSADNSTPIKLFATLSDVDDRAKHQFEPDHWSRSQCWTLREMLGLDSNRPQTSIDWLVLCNYMIDFDFLLDEVPELVSVPHVLCFYGIADTPWTAWRAASPSSVFVQVNPSDPPGPSNPLTSRIPYGVHHTKMFLIGFADGTLRVIIHTANLRYNDIHLKTQGAYVQDFPFKGSNRQASEFEDDLVSYLQSYRYEGALPWTATLPQETLVLRIRRYDFSSAVACLIPSTPGYHKVDAKLGHVALKRSVRSHASPVDRHARIVCQFSSIGSLTEKYLSELQESMSAQGSLRPNPSNVQISLVYPTVEEIRTSVQGYHGGGSVPGTSKNVSKPFLRRLFCRWSSLPNASSLPTNPIWKPSNVPHIKSYYQTCPDGESLSWLVLSSHNLSKAAWGEAINTKFGRRLFIRHWELGVFFSPKLLCVKRLVPWSTANARTKDRGDALVPLPYNLFPDSYQPIDQPWAVDLRYTRPDKFGRCSTHDP